MPAVSSGPKELFTSIDIIEQCVKKIPDGPVDVKVTGAPNGEYFSRAEQPRGEVVHYIKGNGKKNLVRHRVRTPTFTNIPPLVKLLKGVRTRRCAGRCPDDRPLYRLRGEVRRR